MTQTVAFENAERILRFQSLAALINIEPPVIEQLYASAGTDITIDGPVPVVQAGFTGRVFFDTASDMPRPETLAVLNLIADNIRLDVAGVQVTVLGHTDAVGGEEYNMALSERRAATVLYALIDRGVDPRKLSAVAIGKRQPIATNTNPPRH
jgi:outer membrane protein OmpA-like peptidoglycan-associated protein